MNDSNFNYLLFLGSIGLHIFIESQHRLNPLDLKKEEDS